MIRAGLALVACLGLACASGAQAGMIAGVVPDIPTGASPPSWSVPNHNPLARVANLPYQGGPVLHTNRTHLVFWQPSGTSLAYPPGYQPVVEQFMARVAADSHQPTNVYSLTGQYTDSSGPASYNSTYGGAVVAADPLPLRSCTEPPTGPRWADCVVDAQIQFELEHVIGVDRLPITSHDVYFLVLPDGLGACVDSDPQAGCALGGAAHGSFCGYHSATPDGVLYAVIPFNAVSGHCQSGNPRPNSSPADPTISTLSHEHNETVTDPYGSAWIDLSTSSEDGDLCISQYGADLGGGGVGAWNQVIDGGHYYLQSEWSNWDGACAARTPPDSASFPGPAHPRAGQTVTFTARANATRGSITAYNWFFGDRTAGRHQRTSHRYRRSGSYRVLVRTTDSGGLWAYSARTIRVGKPVAKSRPTAGKRGSARTPVGLVF